MQELLTIKLHDYLAAHHPDLLLSLGEAGKVKVYLEEKVQGINDEMESLLAGDTPAYMVEIHCMDILITSLGNSNYDYIYNLLEDEFEESFTTLERQGILLFEVINIIQHCSDLLNGFDEDDKFLRYTVIAAIDEYFAHPSTVAHGV